MHNSNDKLILINNLVCQISAQEKEIGNGFDY